MTVAFVEYFTLIVQLHAQRVPDDLAAKLLEAGAIVGHRLLIDANVHCTLTREFRQRIPKRFDRLWLSRTDHLVPIGFQEFVWNFGADHGQEVVLSTPVWQAMIARFYPQTCTTNDPSAAADGAEEMTSQIRHDNDRGEK